MAFALVLTLNRMTIGFPKAVLALAWIYLFMKQVSYLPEFMLGAEFS
ncbi:MAG: hypothetical protein ACFC1C_02930 [Candidatus Malihini olakiniferum]